MLAEAQQHCADLARAHARDQWLGALYAPPDRRGALMALASFDVEIRQARLRARDPNLAALRLAWWRGVVRGERDEEAAGNPVAVALRAAIDAFALPSEALEAMLDAKLQEIAPQDDFTLIAFEAFAEESEGARIKVASRICAEGLDLDSAGAHAPAGLALALVSMLLALPGKAGAAPTLFPTDVATGQGASRRDFDARNASAGVIAACSELRMLGQAKLADAEARLRASSPAILPAFIPLGAVRLDLESLKQNAKMPFDPPRQASPLRRQWAIWWWARRWYTPTH